MLNRGNQLCRLVDGATQRWVRLTGRSVTWETHPWLEGPVGDPDGIGQDFFDRYAAREGLATASPSQSADGHGILQSFACLIQEPSQVHPEVIRF